MNKEKKPLILAIFLVLGLLGAEGGFLGQKQASGVFGGPASPLPAKFQIIVDDLGALESRNLKTASAEETVGLWGGGALVGQATKAKPMEVKSDPKSSKSKYFIMPTTGLNWGKIHEDNGVDISNSCGTPVYAAADGAVIPDPTLRLNDWSGGYGKFVLIEHSNGTRTRYAHLSKISVEVGDFVTKRQQIGLTGNTGKVDKATGCHLHFEVLGGENPFSK